MIRPMGRRKYEIISKRQPDGTHKRLLLQLYDHQGKLRVTVVPAP
jgi:hypothetical protein